jgi:protein phosphatase PTC7
LQKVKLILKFSIGLEESKITLIDEFTAKEILIKAAEKTNVPGSSTLCLVLLDAPEKKLHTTYIGDSIYMIFRYREGKFELQYKAEEQQHKFNTPYQLGRNGDSPHSSVQYSHDLCHNDILIIATDG